MNTIHSQQPFVSIVMPVYNEAEFIERSLGAVLQQDYPAERVEVLIADGMSSDDTVAIINRMQGAERVTIVPNPERLQSHGLNRIIPLAKGDYILRLDGHTIIEADYVRRCVELLQETGADNVGGAMNPAGITPMGKAIAAAGKSAFGVPTAFHVSDTAQYTDTVYMGAWPRAVFERVGLYRTDVGVNEDYEHNVRIRNHGGKIYFSPDIHSIYYGRQTLKHLWRQYSRYGRSKVKTLKQHPASIKPRQLVAPLFVAGLFGGVPVVALVPALRPLYGLALLAYLTLSGYFALRAVRRQHGEDIAFWRVMLAFGIMHIAWGLGFWREWLVPEKIN